MIVKKPSAGDKILLLKPQYIEQLLRGAKNMEIRSAPYRAGIYYIGTGGQIFGQVRTAHAVPIHNMTEFIRNRHKHHMVCSTLPYKKTYGLPIVACAPVTAHEICGLLSDAQRAHGPSQVRRPCYCRLPMGSAHSVHILM